MGDRETRWVEDYLHRTSKAIVQESVAHGCDRIAFEDLIDIRNRMPGAKKFHARAFRQLYDYVTYKIEVEGIDTHGHKYVKTFGTLIRLSAESAASRRSSSVSNRRFPSS
jgi:IS605 OrfB family transposase